MRPEGEVGIDNGAMNAILNMGKSLLPIGIIGVKGDFGVGAPVELKNGDNRVIGTGLVNYSSTDIKKIMGHRSDMIENCLGYKPYDEVIHRDNLAVTAEPGL